MRKFLLFVPVVVALMTGCNNDEPVFDNIDNGNGETNYLTVNLVSTPNNGSKSRAEGDQTIGDPNNKVPYEEGFASENKVNKVRFYFFNNDGSAAAVKVNGCNYLDWAPEKSDGQNMPNVEKKLEATIVIHTGEGDQLPAQIAAVLNPDTEKLPEENISLSTLRDRTKDYVEAAKGEKGAFVMINSVYAQGSEISTTTVRRENYSETEDGALKKPVTVYVERPVAKVRVKLDPKVGYNEATKRIALKEIDKDKSTESETVYKDITINGEQVYLEIAGWNVTAETTEGYLSKHISTAWNDDLFGEDEPWNYDPYFRSFWALNPTTETFKQNWHSYNDIMAEGGKGFDGKLENSIYLNENAPQMKASKESANKDVEPFTKVVIAGKLVKEDGSAFEIVKYAGMTFVGEENIKASLLKQLSNNGMIYSYVTENGNTTYTELTSADVEFKVALESTVTGVDASEQTTGRYLVYLQLSEAGENKSWSKSNAKDQDVTASHFLNSKEVNEYLVKEIGKVQIYKGGLTYYYFPIRHLGDEGHVGYYGVVRNHIYDCNISTLIGLGTPVYDPDQVIYPEKPKNEDTFIAAAINILSWRVVPNNVTLEW